MEEEIKVKQFKGNPDVYVASGKGIVQVTTSEHLKNANKPLKQILTEICEEARVYANKIFDKYSYPNGNWYPCGSADVVLKWNEHRNIINLFREEATENLGRDYWKGWFGKLFKTSSGQGWWWMPKLDKNSQSMLYEEEVCRFVRQKLALANIKVDVRTNID